MFPKNLRKLREFKNLDRKTLANILGVTYQAVFQYENGVREPSLDILKKISSYFGVTIDYLVYGEENSVNINKIKNLINKLNYNFKEFAQDIGESVFDIENIILNDVEPSEQIISSICDKYGIPRSEFETRSNKAIRNFCKSEENKAYIDLAMFVRDNNFEPDYVKKLLTLINSREQH